MITTSYPILAALAAWTIAQVVKPFIFYGLSKTWNWKLILASGGFPSSHSSTVAAVCLATGIVENFNTSLFAVTLVFSIIICYDACNVRYYAGKNIELTEKLVNDIKELHIMKMDDPIYSEKLKDVLGHTYVEVFSGVLLGLAVSGLMYFLFFRG